MILETLKKQDYIYKSTRRQVLQNQRNINKPLGSFGKIESIGYKISEVVGINKQKNLNSSICIFAGDHGVSELGLSIFKQSQTKVIVEMLGANKTPINRIAEKSNVKVHCYDVGINGLIETNDIVESCKVSNGTKNMVSEDALTRDEVFSALERGYTLADKFKNENIDIVAVGEVGIGNTISTSIITAVLCGKKSEEVTDVGTGIDDEKLLRKKQIIEKIIEKYTGADVITLLCKAGGLEICAEAGFIIGCLKNGIAVILDGYISGAAALVAYEINPNIKKIVFASHMSSEKGHRYIFDKLGLEPLFDWGMHYGIASGSSIALPIITMAYGVTNE